MKTGRRWMKRIFLLVGTLCLVLFVVGAGQTFGTDVAPAGETPGELDESARQIDKACETPEGEALVRKNLTDRFGIADERITELRGQGLGYGEIGILHSLAETSGRDAAELLEMRTVDKMGWGRIAAETGTTVGKALNEMKGIGSPADDTDTITTDRPGKGNKEGVAKDRPEKPEKGMRPEKPEKPDRPDKPEKPGKM